MLPTSRTYWHDHVQTPNPRTPSFLDSLISYKLPACLSLSSNGSNRVDHQDVEVISTLKTLSLCEGKLLKDLTRDSHKPKIWAARASRATLKTWLGFPLYSGKSGSETLILNGLGLSWKILQKYNLHNFRSIKPNFRSIESDRFTQ